MKKWNLSQKTQDWIWATIAAIAFILMVFCYTPTTRAQSVVRNGNQFESKSAPKQKKEATATPYTYKDSTGVYPIYLSSNGNAFIVKVSKKTGKKYRKYLPEVTQQLKQK